MNLLDFVNSVEHAKKAENQNIISFAY